MIERPYRSGARQRCLLCRQSNEIQREVIKRYSQMTRAQISEWLLNEHGIEASDTQVGYFLAKSNVPSRSYKVTPTNNIINKTRAYIEQLLECESETFTIHTIHLSGPSWSCVSRRLHEDGLIEPMRSFVPIQWAILASKDEIRKWCEYEISRIEKQKNVVNERAPTTVNKKPGRPKH